jgi:molybdopterin-dependent oxidoreductase alpha subunit
MIKKRWTPKHWASLRPFGIGLQRPNNYKELLRALSENRDELGFAWRILSQGVCDGCALGTTGMHDWTLDGVHLCNIRLRLLRLNTMPAIDMHVLNDVKSLDTKNGHDLQDLGRLAYPAVRRNGDAGFSRVSWDEALDLIAGRIQNTSHDRMGFYLTSRGMPNEAYYAAQKAVRAMGTNSVDNAARVCHSPSTTALKAAIGYAATTCSYTDWIASDLIVFVGSNIANNQPVATKYLHFAKKNGARILCINSYREPGMERYWIPSLPESALFGTKIADDFYLVHAGGDIAFLNGVMKHMVERGWCETNFIDNHTVGFDALKTELAAQSWDTLERASGTSKEDMLLFADEVAKAKKAVFVWSMGITQHECGVENVQAIANLALSKGFVGREGCGLMPIRGHSGVQGGAEMGAYSTAFPGGLAINEANAAKLKEHWGFDVPITKGMTAVDMVERSHAGELDVLFSVGGNFLDVLPEPAHVREALSRVPLRVHMDIVISKQMLVDPADTVVLLPACTRYETPGGVTQTSTERRVMFSPEIPGRRVGEARPEWDVFTDLARRVRPDLGDKIRFRDTAAIRAEIAKVVPFYDGIQNLKKMGDQFQYGGKHLCEGWKFNTTDGKAHFVPVRPVNDGIPDGKFMVTTRRGKQFNSMVHEPKDAITGAVRDAVFMCQEDAQRLGLNEGDAVLLRNDGRHYSGHVYVAPVKPGNLQIHWPEGNVLLDRTRRAPQAGVPDYNALATLEKVT